MNKKKIDFLKEVLKTHLRALFPHTYTRTFFLDSRRNYVEVLEIDKSWLGVSYETQTYILSHRKRREEFLKKLLESGELTEDGFKKYMPHENETRIEPSTFD